MPGFSCLSYILGHLICISFKVHFLYLRTLSKRYFDAKGKMALSPNSQMESQYVWRHTYKPLHLPVP